MTLDTTKVLPGLLRVLGQRAGLVSTQHQVLAEAKDRWPDCLLRTTCVDSAYDDVNPTMFMSNKQGYVKVCALCKKKITNT